MSTTLLLLIFLVAAGFFFYVFLMIFYPEWVGITGKNAQKNLDDHKEGAKADDNKFFSDMNGKR